jgi:hypothetical protein
MEKRRACEVVPSLWLWFCFKRQLDFRCGCGNYDMSDYGLAEFVALRRRHGFGGDARVERAAEPHWKCRLDGFGGRWGRIVVRRWRSPGAGCIVRWATPRFDRDRGLDYCCASANSSSEAVVGLFLKLPVRTMNWIMLSMGVSLVVNWTSGR